MDLIRIGSLPENDLLFQNPMVSGFHAEIRLQFNQFLLVDLNSTNGTFLDGIRISEANIIVGQTIALGSFSFQLEASHLEGFGKKKSGFQPSIEPFAMISAASFSQKQEGHHSKHRLGRASDFNRLKVSTDGKNQEFAERPQEKTFKLPPTNLSSVSNAPPNFPKPEHPIFVSPRSENTRPGAVRAHIWDKKSLDESLDYPSWKEEDAEAQEALSFSSKPSFRITDQTLFEEIDSEQKKALQRALPKVTSEGKIPDFKATSIDLSLVSEFGDFKATSVDLAPVPSLPPTAEIESFVATLGYHDDNTVHIPAPQVSGRHAKITKLGSRFFLEDLGSTNGTFLNGVKVTAEVPLLIGDQVSLGSYTFTFKESILQVQIHRAKTSPSLRLKIPSDEELDGNVVRVGRAPDNDIVVPAPQVSGHHLELRNENGALTLRDLNSLNGTYINVRSVPIEPGVSTTVQADDVLFLGSYRLPLSRLADSFSEEEDKATIALPLNKKTLTVGRDEDNDLVLVAPQISRRHASLRHTDKGWILSDLGSANGTYVNGRRIRGEVPITPDDVIGFGSYIIRLDPSGGALQKQYQGDIMLRADGISFEVKDSKSPNNKKQILKDISFTAYPTEFIGIMGPSGAGKTTLLMALNGYLLPTEGQSLINELDLYAHYNSFRGNIGYVPQDDIIHPELTVYESLYYTAKLRLPPDTSDAEINALIDQTLEDLGILETRDVLIGSPLKKGISGGQRKRVNLAQELLTQPSLLFLDEPTSGLASSDTRGVMKLLRKLADKGRTILLTIHQPSLEAYQEMDNVLYLVRGKLVYYGPTHPDSITFFHPEVDPASPEGIKLLSTPDSAMLPLALDNAAPNVTERIKQRDEEYRKSEYYRDYVSGRREREGQSKVSISKGTKQRTMRKFGIRQWWTLSRRHFNIKRKDVANSTILFLQAPVIGGIISVVFGLGRDSFLGSPLEQFVAHESGEGVASAALFMLVASAVWFGTSNAAREIVSEQAIYRRERMVNLKIPSYVMSKFTVLGVISLVQCAVLLGVTYPFLNFGGSFHLMLLILFLCSAAGLGFGLLLSALVRSSEAAVALVPILLIPQIVLGGLIVPFKDLQGSDRTLIRYSANLLIARWGFEGLLHLEEAVRPPPKEIDLKEETKALIDELFDRRSDKRIRPVFDKHFSDVDIPFPRFPPSFAGQQPSPERVEEFKDKVGAWRLYYQQRELTERQDEVSRIDRYFGDTSSGILFCIFVLLLFEIFTLCVVCLVLRIKDVEVG